MIQPSGPLLYQDDLGFKKFLFSKNNLLQVIDLTNLADKLWGQRNIATAVIFIQKTAPDNSDVLHLIANRTYTNQNRIFLEFDHYDFHNIEKSEAVEKTHVWKANLIGGGRIKGLVERLASIETLGEFLTEKENDGWKTGEGFIEKGVNSKECTFITGYPYLPSDAFKDNEIEVREIKPCEIQKFYRTGDEKIYHPPHLIIKENIGENALSVRFIKDYLVFRANIIGIHAPKHHENHLKKIEEYFRINGNVLRFYMTATSPQMSISKATVPIKDDFMNLPFSLSQDNIQISEAEEILVSDTLNYLRGKEKNRLYKHGSSNDLQIFSRLFCKTLNSIYETQKSRFQLFKILSTERHFVLHFEYSNDVLNLQEEEQKDLVKYIDSVIPSINSESSQTHIQRIMKIYGPDCIILAKPKQLRYWRPSIALRDADESFADYLKAKQIDA